MTRRIRNIGPTYRRIDPDEVAKALGAEYIGKSSGNLFGSYFECKILSQRKDRRNRLIKTYVQNSQQCPTNYLEALAEYAGKSV